MKNNRWTVRGQSCMLRRFTTCACKHDRSGLLSSCVCSACECGPLSPSPCCGLGIFDCKPIAVCCTMRFCCSSPALVNETRYFQILLFSSCRLSGVAQSEGPNFATSFTWTDLDLPRFQRQWIGAHEASLALRDSPPVGPNPPSCGNTYHMSTGMIWNRETALSNSK